MSYTVGVLIGSLSEHSINRKLFEAISKLPSDKITFIEIPIKDLPLYDHDLDANYPAVAVKFKEAIAETDALLYVTPEYNRSIPGALKNAIDWASRPYGHGVLSKPSAIAGASGGPLGTAVAQAHLKTILTFFGAVQYSQPELYIQWKDGIVDETGGFGENSLGFFQQWLTGFEAFLDHEVQK